MRPCLTSLHGPIALLFAYFSRAWVDPVRGIHARCRFRGDGLDLGVVDEVGELVVAVIAGHGQQCQTERPSGTPVAVPMSTTGEWTAYGWQRRGTGVLTSESRELCEVCKEKLAISWRGSADAQLTSRDWYDRRASESVPETCYQIPITSRLILLSTQDGMSK